MPQGKRAEERAKRKEERRAKRRSLGSKLLIAGILVFVIWVVYALAQPAPPPPPSSGGALNFTLPVVGPNGPTGQSISLSQFRGKVVVLEFMEPWCIHCQNMAPTLAKLYAQYDQSDVVVISVAGPWSGASANDAAQFIRTYGSSWTYVYDSSGTVFSSYGVTSTPTIVLVSKSGNIAGTRSGEVEFSTLIAMVEQARGS